MAVEPKIVAPRIHQDQIAICQKERGQALVEYAILLVVITLLVAGGVELGTAAFNANRAANAAEQGVSAWIYSTGGADVYVPSGMFEAGVYSGIGDHVDLTRFSRPECNVSGYDDGLPDDSVTNAAGTRDAVYLFNPKPIDVTDCLGRDVAEPTKTRQSRLYEALPRLNRALIPLYTERCANAVGDEIPCANVDQVVTRFLRLPGKLDLVSDTVSLAFLDMDPASANFKLPLPDSPRAVLEALCRIPGSSSDFAPCDSTICAASPAPYACHVRVIVRFRHVFYSFLQKPFVLWDDPLPEAALDQMDLGGAGVYAGGLGSEIGLGNVRLFNRTFQWCYETAPLESGRLVPRLCGDTNPI